MKVNGKAFTSFPFPILCRPVFFPEICFCLVSSSTMFKQLGDMYKKSGVCNTLFELSLPLPADKGTLVEGKTGPSWVYLSDMRPNRSLRSTFSFTYSKEKQRPAVTVTE